MNTLTYEKALSALDQALKLYSKNDLCEKSSQIECRIKIVERFLEAREFEQTN
jgi:flagellin-specific chaperone FliS